MAPGPSKLSLVAQFDDFCRKGVATTDTTTEERFLEFVRNQEECRKRWHSAAAENAELKKIVASQNATIVELERKLMNTKQILQKEIHRREKCEEEKESKLRQIELIREFIMNDTELRDETIEKLPFLRPTPEDKHDYSDRLGTIDESIGSALSPSGDDLDISDSRPRRSSRFKGRGKRRSSAEQISDSGSPIKKKTKPGHHDGKQCKQGVAHSDKAETLRLQPQPTISRSGVATTKDARAQKCGSQSFQRPRQLYPEAKGMKAAAQQLPARPVGLGANAHDQSLCRRAREKQPHGVCREHDENDSGCANVIATTTVTLRDARDLVATSRLFTQPLTPTPTAPPPPPSETAPKTRVTPKFTSGSAPSTPVAQRRGEKGLDATTPRRSNSAGRLLSREHIFCPKTVIKAESCGPCGKRIKFYKTAYKCNRCRSVCHIECKDQVPLPCIPASQTPTQGGTAGRHGRIISDYVPPTPPMVPALVIHCIQEVEKRGMQDVGLYRIPGAEREVRELRQQFERGKGVPNMSKADIHAVCGVLKDFLRSLRETLIVKSLWKTFVNAAQVDDGDRVWAMWQAVMQLPQPNRDTLAALVLHLQNVASHHQTKMPISNLARVFGPTVVGFSSNDMTAVANLLAETEQQAQVMEALMTVPADYWEQLLDVDSDEDIGTPEIRAAPGSTLLGPIYGSLGRKNSQTTPKRPAPSSCSRLASSTSAKKQRNLAKGTSSGPKKISFYSPIMK
ncbi:rac GTPase-activating protein 1 isoform X1 [Rhipicephalus microplus]|uniref:rac GTPase-activating protein 1 isoform X1 n=1 Tax=Rhipicephalus microplus TaxID=6941 RepID=UPI003F6AEED8